MYTSSCIQCIESEIVYKLQGTILTNIAAVILANAGAVLCFIEVAYGPQSRYKDKDIYLGPKRRLPTWVLPLVAVLSMLSGTLGLYSNRFAQAR